MINTQLQQAYRFLLSYGFSIRRISHIGQALPDQKEIIKQKYVKYILKKERIEYFRDEDLRIIKMDETPCYLSIGFATTIDFK